MPLIDGSPTGGQPGRSPKTAWVTLIPSEAEELFEALWFWVEEVEEGIVDPAWHAHFADSAGNELTIEIAGTPETRSAEQRPRL
jgi:hypothetical protein